MLSHQNVRLKSIGIVYKYEVITYNLIKYDTIYHKSRNKNYDIFESLGLEILLH